MSWLLGALRALLVMVKVFVAGFLVHANALSFICGPSCVHQLCQPPFVGRALAVHSSTRVTWITKNICELLLSSSSHKLANEARCIKKKRLLQNTAVVHGHGLRAGIGAGGEGRGGGGRDTARCPCKLQFVADAPTSRFPWQLLCTSEFRQPPADCNVTIASSVSCTGLASSCALGHFLVLLSQRGLDCLLGETLPVGGLRGVTRVRIRLALVLSFGRLAWVPVPLHLTPLLVPRYIVGVIRALVRQPVGVPCRNCGQCHSTDNADGSHDPPFSHVVLVCPLAHSLLALLSDCSSPSSDIRTPFGRLSGGNSSWPFSSSVDGARVLAASGSVTHGFTAGPLLRAASLSAISASSRLVR